MITPGPWTVRYSPPHGYAIEAGGKHIATSILYARDGGMENAKLMAEAPSLKDRVAKLELALSMLRAHLAEYIPPNRPWKGPADTAIEYVDSVLGEIAC